MSVIHRSLVDEVEERSAALAFHIILALVPLLFLLLSLGTFFLTEDAVIVFIVSTATEVFGESVSAYLALVLEIVRTHSHRIVASIVGIAVLLFAAARAIYHLRSAFETILAETPVVMRRRTVLGLVRYAVSMAVLMMLLMFIIFLILLKSLLGMFDGNAISAVFVSVMNYTGTAIVFCSMWGALMYLYRLFTPTSVQTKTLMQGSFIAALLVTLCTESFTLILTDASVEAYGVASALIALMLWCYYTTMALLVGAECVNVFHQKSQK